MNMKNKLADRLVWAANKLVGTDMSPTKAPYYRPVDTHMSGIGHKYASGAYSYEGLKSLIEQDGPKGFGARATVKWLISEEGWKDISDMDAKEVRRTFAMSGIDMDGEL